jgi:hypothetical protein
VSDVPKIPEGPEGQPLRALFYRLGLDPKNPQHHDEVQAYIAKHAGVGGPPPEWPDCPPPVRNARRPQKWDALKYRRLVQRVELLRSRFPSELEACRVLAKRVPEYKGMKPRTLQWRLAEARKVGIA